MDRLLRGAQKQRRSARLRKNVRFQAPGHALWLRLRGPVISVQPWPLALVPPLIFSELLRLDQRIINRMASEGQSTEIELLERARRGDQDGLLLIYRRWHAVVFRFALNMSGNRTLAEDVAQDVFLSLIRDPVGFDPCKGRFSTYLYAIVRNRLIGELRRDKARESAAERAAATMSITSVDQGNPLEDISHRQRVQSLRDTILRLPPRYREVVVLCELEEMEYSEVAEALGCPVGTVRSRLHRARTILAERLKASQPADRAAEGARRRRCLA